ncbi:MAG TPA: hypothetical protein VM938_04775 [Acidimicrobiales bacterium]|nr:hypothetical protein [Acidimicrobiales bacterium]
MAAGPVKDAGEEVPCPSCGTQVLQKKTIPVLADGGSAAPPAYLCIDCARATRPAEAAAG